MYEVRKSNYEANRSFKTKDYQTNPTAPQALPDGNRSRDMSSQFQLPEIVYIVEDMIDEVKQEIKKHTIEQYLEKSKTKP